MGSVVCTEFHKFDSPALPVRKILFPKPRKELSDLFNRVLMTKVFNLGGKGWWVAENVIFKIN